MDWYKTKFRGEDWDTVKISLDEIKYDDGEPNCKQIVFFKKLRKTATEPTKTTEGSAGYDLYSETVTKDKVYTGIALEIPEGYVGLIKNRSSLGNYVFEGTIDSDYRGELILLINPEAKQLHKGRVAQLLIQKVEDVSFIETKELSTTNRGTGGFGSTGI